MRIHLFVLFLWRRCLCCSNLDPDNDSTPDPWAPVDPSEKGLFATESTGNHKGGNQPGVVYTSPQRINPPGDPPGDPVDPPADHETPPRSPMDPTIFVHKKSNLSGFVIAFDKPNSTKSRRDRKAAEMIYLIPTTRKAIKDWDCQNAQLSQVQGDVVMGRNGTDSFLVACGVKLENGKDLGCKKLESNSTWTDVKDPLPSQLITLDSNDYRHLTFTFTWKGIWAVRNINNKDLNTWMLDLVDETWSESVQLPVVLSDFCVVSRMYKDEDETLLIGGLDESNNSLNSVYYWSWKLNTSQTEWTYWTAMPHSRHGMACGWNDTKVYVIGGLAENDYVDIATNVLILDVVKKNWTYGTPLRLSKDFQGIARQRVFFHFGALMIIWKTKFYSVDDPLKGFWKTSDMFPQLENENATVAEVIADYLPGTCIRQKDEEHDKMENRTIGKTCWFYPCPTGTRDHLGESMTLILRINDLDGGKPISGIDVLINRPIIFPSQPKNFTIENGTVLFDKDIPEHSEIQLSAGGERTMNDDDSDWEYIRNTFTFTPSKTHACQNGLPDEFHVQLYLSRIMNGSPVARIAVMGYNCRNRNKSDMWIIPRITIIGLNTTSFRSQQEDNNQAKHNYVQCLTLFEDGIRKSDEFPDCNDCWNDTLKIEPVHEKEELLKVPTTRIEFNQRMDYIFVLKVAGNMLPLVVNLYDSISPYEATGSLDSFSADHYNKSSKNVDIQSRDWVIACINGNLPLTGSNVLILNVLVPKDLEYSTLHGWCKELYERTSNSPETTKTCITKTTLPYQDVTKHCFDCDEKS